MYPGEQQLLAPALSSFSVSRSFGRRAGDVDRRTDRSRREQREPSSSRVRLVHARLLDVRARVVDPLLPHRAARRGRATPLGRLRAARYAATGCPSPYGVTKPRRLRLRVAEQVGAGAEGDQAHRAAWISRVAWYRQPRAASVTVNAPRIASRPLGNHRIRYTPPVPIPVTLRPPLFTNRAPRNRQARGHRDVEHGDGASQRQARPSFHRSKHDARKLAHLDCVPAVRLGGDVLRPG